MSPSLHDLTDRLIAFRDARDWRKFHSLKNLILSLNLESAEVLELAQWKDDAQVEAALSEPEFRARLAEECADVLPEIAGRLREVADEWGELTLTVGASAQEDLDEVGAASVDYLMYSGYATLAYFWARMAMVAQAELAAGETDHFFEGKVATARFYFARLLPRAEAHRRAALAGAESLLALDQEGF